MRKKTEHNLLLFLCTFYSFSILKFYLHNFLSDDGHCGRSLVAAVVFKDISRGRWLLLRRVVAIQKVFRHLKCVLARSCELKKLVQVAFKKKMRESILYECFGVSWDLCLCTSAAKVAGLGT